jgi:single-strand DNA-binding protein
MYRMKNSVQLIGQVCSIPKITAAKDGAKRAGFLMVTTEQYKNSSDELVKDTDWHFVSAKGKLAEFIVNKITQGMSVAVEGKLCSRNYVNKANVEVKSSEIQVRELLIV